MAQDTSTCLGNTLPSCCLRYRPRGVLQVRGVSRTPIVSTSRGNSCDKMRTTQMSCAQEELDIEIMRK